MARSYQEVLEDTINNQAKQICQLVAQNESIVEINSKLANELKRAQNALSQYTTDSTTSNSGGQVVQFEPLSDLSERQQANSGS